MRYSFILLAAGKGVRVGKSTPKQFLPLAGKPMLLHTLERVDFLTEVSEIVVVCNDEYIGTIKSYAEKYSITKKIVFAKGGETRQESVYNGLRAASEENIIIHEAARPLVSVEEFETLIRYPYSNVTFACAIPFTVLKRNAENIISDILERDELVNIQLPQKFEREALIACHDAAIKENKSFTEDASMMKFYLNKTVHCLPGSGSNIKITEYTDFLFGELLFREKFVEESI